jgi:hypothetical protein
MDRTVISWTFENWITVVLMVFLGGLVYGLVARAAYSMAPRDA